MEVTNLERVVLQHLLCSIVAPITATNTSIQEEKQTTLLLLLVGLELDVELEGELAVGSLFEVEGAVASPSTTSTVVASPMHAATEHSFCVLLCISYASIISLEPD